MLIAQLFVQAVDIHQKKPKTTFICADFNKWIVFSKHTPCHFQWSKEERSDYPTPSKSTKAISYQSRYLTYRTYDSFFDF